MFANRDTVEDPSKKSAKADIIEAMLNVLNKYCKYRKA
jgi:hypothetical protein